MFQHLGHLTHRFTLNVFFQSVKVTISKRKRSDYCNADARQNEANIGSRVKCEFLTPAAQKVLLNGRHFAVWDDAQYKCLSCLLPLSGGIMVVLRR